jgi:WD40 repeat protein
MIRSRRVEEAMAYLNRALDYNPKNTNAAALLGTMVLEWARNPALEKAYDIGSAVSLVSFSKTGRYCFVTLADDRVICFDIAAGWRKTFEAKQTYSALITVFSDDESRVAFCSAGEVIVRQVSDGAVIGSVQHVGSGYVTCLSFNPAGSLLAIGDAEGAFVLLRVERDLPVDFRHVYPGEIRQTEFSSDGSSVLISVKGGAGASILPVNLASHELAGPEVKLALAPDLLRWTHDSDKYVVLGNEGLRVVRLATGEVSNTIVPVQNRLQNASLVLSPDGQWLAFADYNLVKLIRVSPDGNLDQSKERSYPHGGPITDLRFSDDGRLLFSASRDGTGSIYDTDSASVNFVVTAPEAPMLAYLPVPKLGKAISCSEDGIFATWDLRWQGAMQMDLYAGTPDPVRALHFDEQQRILGFTENGHLLRWDSASSEVATTIASTAGRFSDARFLSEARLVSAIDNDHRTLRVLQADTLRDVMAPFPLPPKTRTYCVSPELEIFAVIAADGALNVYTWKGKWLFGRGGIAPATWPTVTIDASRREIIVTSERTGSLSRTSFLSAKDGHEVREPIEGKQFGHLAARDDCLYLIERSGQNANELVVWEREGRRRTREIPVAWQVKAPMWALTDRVVAVQGWGNIEIWDVQAGAFRSYISTTNAATVQDIAIDSQGGMAVICGEDGSVSAKEIRIKSDALKTARASQGASLTSGIDFDGEGVLTRLNISERIQRLRTLKEDFSQHPPVNDLEQLIAWKIESGCNQRVAPNVPVSRDSFLVKKLRKYSSKDLDVAFWTAPLSSLVTFQQALHSADQKRSTFLRNCAVDRLPDEPRACLKIAKDLIEIENKAAAETVIAKAVSLGASADEVKSLRDAVAKLIAPGQK